MLTATVSSKGQIVVPAELRRRLGLKAGDTVVFDTRADDQEAVFRRRETWDELSARFHSWIAPGTPPLEDVHAFYETREPRT
ncbi:MAG: AbrB/MazE/SpoVT family DNA-binding domain-containing protein [Propionibacteriaceae bacterium]|jgi:AbrB family looped-hinge helix DNA binding protein|nr:AbrB/MazE/SpoVT family DNA-binding domain-containing protein [Propionibacteriaceae bacterium]